MTSDEKNLLMPLNENDIMHNIYVKLKNGKIKSVNKYCKKKNVLNYFKENSMDAVPKLTIIFEEDFCSENVVNSIERLLKIIATIGNIKETALVFLEEVTIFRRKDHFPMLVKPLKILLSREGKNKSSKISTLILHSLYSQLSLLNIPNNDNLEGTERHMFENNPDIQEVLKVFTVIDECIDYAFDEISKDNMSWVNISPKDYFVFYLLKYFNKPFPNLELHHVENEAMSASYMLCKKYVEMIITLYPNVFKLFPLVKPKLLDSNIKKKSLHDEIEVDNSQPSQLALATFFCCIFSQKFDLDALPCVYSPEYIYFSCIPCCVHLLDEKNSQIVFKGLKLFNSILLTIEKKSLPCSSLDAPNHYELSQSLIKIMTFCENKECRTMALSSSKCFLEKIDSSGQLKLISTILTTVSHAGIQGVFIHELKEIINASHSSDSQPRLIDDGFSWNRIEHVLILVCSLPEAEKTDLLDWSDKIMAALNLLIFMCLRSIYDKNKLKLLSATYLDQLNTGLRLSKGHYKLKLKEFDDPKQRKLTKISVNIGEDSFPNMPPEQEKSVIESALNYFDMMDSILVRVMKLLSSPQTFQKVSKNNL